MPSYINPKMFKSSRLPMGRMQGGAIAEDADIERESEQAKRMAPQNIAGQNMGLPQPKKKIVTTGEYIRNQGALFDEPEPVRGGRQRMSGGSILQLASTPTLAPKMERTLQALNFAKKAKNDKKIRIMF